jgi:MbtH protein
MGDEREDDTIYDVVVNDEEQYSIWPADLEGAPGWRTVGKRGPKAECLAYIEEMWTDMRPLSLRRQMEAAAGPPPSAAGAGALADRS